jgi:hypothetical protein
MPGRHPDSPNGAQTVEPVINMRDEARRGSMFVFT